MLNIFDAVPVDGTSGIVPPNAVDKWFLSLTGKFDGWGMVLFILLTLCISGILSGIIGIERYKKGKSAGISTHSLLSVGTSILMTVSIWAINFTNTGVNYDGSRIAAGAITGIGFIGAGVIIKDRLTVKGLSTAATLWVCAAIGLATGAGFVLEAIILTLVTVLVIFVRTRIITHVDKRAPRVVLKTKKDYEVFRRVKEICEINSLNLKKIDIVSIDEKDITTNVYFPYFTNSLTIDYFILEIKKDSEVIEATKVVKGSNK